MVGDKNIFNENLGSSGTEGALRNHLAITGPGIPAGAVDNTLLSLADILPTIAELSNATDTANHMPWSGVSFANLLKPKGKATQEQQERFMFTLVTSGDKRQCPQLVKLMREMLPDVGPNRWVKTLLVRYCTGFVGLMFMFCVNSAPFGSWCRRLLVQCTEMITKG
jgi:arylsulfatase A-like enzyme